MSIQSAFYQAIQQLNQITTCTDIDDLLTQTLDVFVHVTQAEAGLLYIYDSSIDRLVLAAIHNNTQTGYDLRGLRVHTHGGVVGYTHGMKQPVFVPDISQHAGWDEALHQILDISLHSLYIIPLIANHEPVGVIHVFNPPSDKAQKAEQRELLANLSLLCASMVYKSRQVVEAQRRSQRLMVLVNIMSSMVTTMESNRLLDDIMTYARELLDVETTSIWLKDDKTGDMILHIATGEQDQGINNLCVPAGQGIIGHVISTGHSIIVNDVQNSEYFYDQIDQQLGFTTRSILCVPLQAPRIQPRDNRQGTVQETIIGGAQALNKRDGQPFTEEDTFLFELLASQAATTLQILWLYEETSVAQKGREVAESANRAKNIFLSTMSHELRTPLNAIIGYSELLAEDAKDMGFEGFVPDLQKIRSSGIHLLAIINNILDISRIESGKIDIHLEIFDIRNMVESIVTTINPAITKKGNELNVLADDVGTMCADPDKIQQTLFNILNNANKFTDYGTITLRVERQERTEKPEWSPSQDWIVFSIQDTGIGMTADETEHIFEVFGQADTSSTRKYGGTGLGLAIARRFCRMMGGDITVESKVSHGTTFSVWIPSVVQQQEGWKM